MAKQNIIEQAAGMATRYNEINAQIKLLEDEKDKIKPHLLDVFHTIGLDSFRVAGTGDLCTRVVRKGVAIVNEVFAIKWAQANGCMQIDSRAVAKKLENAPDVPEGFEAVESEWIKITPKKEKK